MADTLNLAGLTFTSIGILPIEFKQGQLINAITGEKIAEFQMKAEDLAELQQDLENAEIYITSDVT